MSVRRCWGGSFLNRVRAPTPFTALQKGGMSSSTKIFPGAITSTDYVYETTFAKNENQRYIFNKWSGLSGKRSRFVVEYNQGASTSHSPINHLHSSSHLFVVAWMTAKKGRDNHLDKTHQTLTCLLPEPRSKSAKTTWSQVKLLK